MPPEKITPGGAPDWIRRARSDLALASIPLPQDSLYSDLCFHAQQAVEKSLKAVLIHFGIEFKKVHHIGYLVNMLPQEVFATLPVKAEVLSELTSYAVMFRYPGSYEDAVEEDLRQVVSQARLMLDWAQALVSQPLP